MSEKQSYQMSIYEDIILTFTLKNKVIRSLVQKNYAKGGIQRLRVKINVTSKIVTAAHHYEVIHQHSAPLVIIQWKSISRGDILMNCSYFSYYIYFSIHIEECSDHK